MSLIILCGLDRTGKSTVAKYFESLGFETIHQSAPRRGMTKDEYLQEQVDIVSSASTKDIVLDRSYYGEACIWPIIYGRAPLLDEEGLEILREIEESVGVQRIWMTDDDITAHWQRCLDNKEPLDKAQFTRARGLYSSMASRYNFEKVTLPLFIKQYPDAQRFMDTSSKTTPIKEEMEEPMGGSELTVSTNNKLTKTPEQTKLEIANAINDILSKKILKQRGDIYESIESDIRNFLNSRLSALLGTNNQNDNLSLTKEEITFYKMMFKRAMKEKQ